MAALLVVIPLADFVNNVWPPHPGSVAWRYAAEGLFSGALPTITLGMLLGAGVALGRRSRRAAATIGALNWLLVAGLLPVAVDFLLSAMQLRAEATPDPAARGAYDLGTVRVSAKYLVAAAALAWLALALRRWRRNHAQHDDAGPLVRKAAPGAENR